MQLPSFMRMLRDILLRIAGTLIFHWPFDYASRYVPGDTGLWMLEYWWMSENHASIGQTTMNQFYPHLQSARTVRNTVLKWIGSVQVFVQTSLTSLWSSRQMEPSWKPKSFTLMLY
jgi:hypothetical protein